MPDTIERTIYRLELDDSGYIRGVNSAAESTKKLSDAQEKANQRLKENEAALKSLADIVEKDRKALENYAGTDAKFKKQLEDSLRSSQTAYAKTAEVVALVRKKYEDANKAAQDFANTAARAAQIQGGGGKIPVPGIIPEFIPPAPIIPPVVFEDFDLSEILSANTIEFERLRSAIETAEKALAGLDQEGEEFKQLAPVIQKGREVLKQYDEQTKKTTGSTQSLRTQIRLGKEELVRLEEAGQGATQQYFDLEKNVARLTDAFNDQQQRIRILASDTRLLDFGKGAITAATSAFQVYTSVAILTGNQSEELQKKTMQLFAAMQLLQGLEQLSNLTRREGILFTGLQSAAQATYTAVVGTSTGALRAFRLALLATGIGAAVVIIGLLVKKFIDLREAQKKAAAEQKLFNDVNNDAAKAVSGQLAQLEVYRRKLNDLSLSEKDRITVAKEYNKISDEQNKIDVKQIGNLEILNQQIDKQTKLIIARAVATAATAKIGEAADEFVAAQLRLTQELQTAGQTEEEVNKKIQAAQEASIEGRNRQIQSLDNYSKRLPANVRAQKDASDRNSSVLDKDTEALRRFVSERNQARVKLDDISRKLLPLISVPGLTTPEKEKADKAIKEIQNDFDKKKAELDERLAALLAKEAEDESKIRIQFAARLAKEQLEITKSKNLTAPQKVILNTELVEINELELNKALEDFRKKITDARQKLNDELRALQEKAISDELNLIQDEFDRRARLIDFNQKRELEAAKKQTRADLQKLEQDRLLVGEQAYQEAKAVIISTGEQNALNIIQKFSIDRQALAADTFKDLLDSYNRAILSADLVRDEGLAAAIRVQSQRFLTGKISFEKFQKEITKIQGDAESQRRDSNLATLRNEQAELDRHIEVVLDKTSNQYKELLRLRDELRRKIADAEKADAEKDAQDTQDDSTKRKVNTIEEYASAIGAVTESVIAFWQKANEAESKALDRSIALQEKRVDAAQRIAARGNAEYLKAEEDRLRELTIKRENAARRELGINAALQASQLLVGITGAISKIATPGIGIAEVIASMAVIFTSLAAGYGLVKSLQGNQPRLFKGTKKVTREREPSGIDTIPAWLTEGEAVIPAHRNKQYEPTVAAVFDGTIPPETINNFVRNYHQVKQVVQPNYERIKDSAEVHISHDGKVAGLLSEQNRKIDENTEVQKQTLRALKSMGIAFNWDKNGVELSLMEAIDKREKDKRV